ncbi:MAG: sigma-70 family RNA polymerase sigma factor [Planctomycetes bacterium]|nr:sigma-70 family RNA polymerase sigma factor [Planctomycetota bacterium]
MSNDELEALILAHQAEVYRYVRFLGAEDVSVAEDLVQDAFLAAFRSNNVPETNDERVLGAWLRGIARNLFLNHCRRRRNSPVKVNSESLEQAEACWTQEFLGEEDGFEVIEALRRCVGRLEDRKREIIDQFYAKNASRAELAKVFKMSEDGIKSMMRRIRGELADCIRRRMEAGRAS